MDIYFIYSFCFIVFFLSLAVKDIKGRFKICFKSNLTAVKLEDPHMIPKDVLFLLLFFFFSMTVLSHLAVIIMKSHQPFDASHN